MVAFRFGRDLVSVPSDTRTFKARVVSASAVSRARQAAGDKAVQVVGGASVSKQLLSAGLVDEIRLDIMPMVLGAGLPLFVGLEGLRLQKIEVQEVGMRTSLRFEVVR